MRRIVPLRQLVSTVVFAAAGTMASAQESDTLKHRVMRNAPTATRLVAVAAKVTNTKATFAANVGGKVIRVTPARSIRTDPRDASFIGTLQTQVPGKATGLKPGRYDLYLTRLRDGYHLYAISTRTRKIAAEGKDVLVSEAAESDTSAISDADWRTTIVLGCGQRCKAKVESRW